MSFIYKCSPTNVLNTEVMMTVGPMTCSLFILLKAEQLWDLQVLAYIVSPQRKNKNDRQSY